MRRLIVRMTLSTATLAALIAALIGMASKLSWSVTILRALLAFGIVAVAGAGVGLVLMRTALRRYYEQGRVTHAAGHPRADR
jgi:predicted RND superfamily exporter protein